MKINPKVGKRTAVNTIEAGKTFCRTIESKTRYYMVTAGNSVLPHEPGSVHAVDLGSGLVVQLYNTTQVEEVELEVTEK